MTFRKSSENGERGMEDASRKKSRPRPGVTTPAGPGLVTPARLVSPAGSVTPANLPHDIDDLLLLR